jgi:hypothetical protein
MNKFVGENTNRAVVTIPAGIFSEEIQAFIYPLLLNRLSADFLGNCKPDYSDIVVLNSREEVLPRYISIIDGIIQWTAPATTDTSVFYIQCGSGNSFQNDPGTWLSAGVVLALLFQERSGDYTDSTGLGHNAEVVSPSGVLRGAQGPLGSAVEFPNSDWIDDGYLKIQHSLDISFRNNADFTFLFWVQPLYFDNTSGSWIQVANKASDYASFVYPIYSNPARGGDKFGYLMILPEFSYQEGVTHTSPRSFPINQWVLGCCTRKSGVVEMWADAVKLPLSNDPAVLPPPEDSPLYIGAYTEGYVGECAARLSRYRMFNRALNPAEIAGYYALEKMSSTAGAIEEVVINSPSQISSETAIGMPSLNASSPGDFFGNSSQLGYGNSEDVLAAGLSKKIGLTLDDSKFTGEAPDDNRLVAKNPVIGSFNRWISSMSEAIEFFYKIR